MAARASTGLILAAVLLCAAVCSVAADRPRVPVPFAIVVSSATAANPDWMAVAEKIKRDRPGAELIVAEGSVVSARKKLAALAPRYAVFILRPDETHFKDVLALRRMMRSLDDDPFDDAIWGIVSGLSPKDAMRMASAKPFRPKSLVSTTGVDFTPFETAFTVSDAYAEGHSPSEYSRPGKPVCVIEKTRSGKTSRRIVRGDTTAEFAKAWAKIDPDLVVTSAHASQRNLEMPFSSGNIISRAGRFFQLPQAQLIDYSTGMARKSPRGGTARKASPLPDAKKDKIWIAAGNCLIGDWPDADCMVAAAIGAGRVVQFIGYIATTWYGEAGWGALERFMSHGATPAEAWYFTNQNLIRKLDAANPEAKNFTPRIDDPARYETALRMYCAAAARSRGRAPGKEEAGMFWDRDATVFYGMPDFDARMGNRNLSALPEIKTSFKPDGSCEITLSARAPLPAFKSGGTGRETAQPCAVALPRSAKPRKVLRSAGCGMFVADDFAIIVSRPAMKAGEELRIVLAPAEK